MPSFRTSRNSWGSACAFDLHAEALELVVLVAGADAQLEPPAGDGVASRFGEQARRMVHGQHADRAAKPDALRLPRHVGYHHQRRGAEAVVGEVVFRIPGGVEAGLIGSDGLPDGRAQHLIRRLVVAALLHQHEDAEFHEYSPRPCLRWEEPRC